MCIALTKQDKICKRKAIDDNGYCELHSPILKLKKTLALEIKEQFNVEIHNLECPKNTLLMIYLKHYELLFKNLEQPLEEVSSRIVNGLDYITSGTLIKKTKEEIVRCQEKILEEQEQYITKTNKILTLYRAGMELLNYQLQFFSDKPRNVLPHVSFDAKISVINEEFKFWKERFNKFVDNLTNYCVKNKDKLENNISSYVFKVKFKFDPQDFIQADYIDSNYEECCEEECSDDEESDEE